MFRRFGIVGLGTVGSALETYFERVQIAPLRYDSGKRLGSITEVNTAEVVFICVPTPFIEGKGFDLSMVESTVGMLEGSKVVVIKSTVLPGTTGKLQRQFPQHKFLMNPEFLREASAVQDMLEPDRQLMGYTEASLPEAQAVLDVLPRAPYARVLPATAVELIKYFTNVFLAAKVTLANEIYDLCECLGVDYSVVAQAVAQDKRIGPSHLKVEPKERGYGGKCLPKDVAALRQLAEHLATEPLVIQAVDKHNRRYRAQAKA